MPNNAPLSLIHPSEEKRPPVISYVTAQRRPTNPPATVFTAHDTLANCLAWPGPLAFASSLLRLLLHAALHSTHCTWKATSSNHTPSFLPYLTSPSHHSPSPSPSPSFTYLPTDSERNSPHTLSNPFSSPSDCLPPVHLSNSSPSMHRQSEKGRQRC